MDEDEAGIDSDEKAQIDSDQEAGIDIEEDEDGSGIEENEDGSGIEEEDGSCIEEDEDEDEEAIDVGGDGIRGEEDRQAQELEVTARLSKRALKQSAKLKSHRLS